MGATASTDWSFSPVVWQDHIEGYFRRKLVYGAFAATESTLTQEPGTTINFPYFGIVGDAEEPEEDEGLEVDNLSDNTFTATVKEVGKAVGIKKKAFKKSAAGAEKLMAEAQRQLGRVMAEKVDKDLLTEFADTGNFTNGYTASSAGHTMSASVLLKAKLIGFGDRADEAKVVFMHSKQYLNLMNDSSTGFLKADATDPMTLVKGFMGYICGLAVVVVDSTKATAAQIASTDAYRAFIHCENAYAYITKQEMEVESDYDILMREWVVTANQWYACKSFHAKNDAQNIRTVECITTVA